MTPKVSSNCFTNSESSMRVISLNASRSSSVLSFAMMAVPSCSRLPAGGVGCWSRSASVGLGRLRWLASSAAASRSSELGLGGVLGRRRAGARRQRPRRRRQPRRRVGGASATASAGASATVPRRRRATPAPPARIAGSSLGLGPQRVDERERPARAVQRTGTRRSAATPSSRRPAWPAAPHATRGRRACLISSARERLAVEHAALDDQHAGWPWRSHAGPWRPRPGRP